MARRAFRVNYTIATPGYGQPPSSVYYGNSEVEAREYATKLFKDAEGGFIEIEELDAFDVGVPDDEELLRMAQEQEAARQAPDWMRSPGNVNG